MIKGLVIFLCSIVLVTGCYTIVKHPVIIDEENPDLSYNIYFSDDCMSCHSSPNLSIFPNLDYINSSSRWSYFYEYPWWHRDAFYTSEVGGQDNGSSSTPLPTTSARPRFPGSVSSQQTGTPGTISSQPSSPGSNTRVVSGENSDSTATTNRDNNDNKNSSKVRSSSRATQKGSGTTNGKNRSKRKE